MSARTLAAVAALSAAIGLCSSACSKSDGEAAEAPSPQPSGSQDAGSPPAPQSSMTGTLEADIIGHADVSLDLFADGSTGATIKLELGHGLLPAGAVLEGKGRVELFPEASTTLYTAKMSAPPSPDGLCGDKPLSLALALRRVGSNARVAGGVSAYCGEGVYHGSPVRIVRLTGQLGP